MLCQFDPGDGACSKSSIPIEACQPHRVAIQRSVFFDLPQLGSQPLPSMTKAQTSSLAGPPRVPKKKSALKCRDKHENLAVASPLLGSNQPSKTKLWIAGKPKEEILEQQFCESLMNIMRRLFTLRANHSNSHCRTRPAKKADAGSGTTSTPSPAHVKPNARLKQYLLFKSSGESFQDMSACHMEASMEFIIA